MLRNAVLRTGQGLEAGIGSGRFAVPPGIRYGIDPSRNLLQIAKSRGIGVMRGEGEHLPCHSGTFDYLLRMTVICFPDDVAAVFPEAGRVLVPGGVLVIGFIERGGGTGEHERNEMTKGRFLQYARFWSGGEVSRLLEDVRIYQCHGQPEIAGILRDEGQEMLVLCGICR